MDIVIASNNAHKVVEIKTILGDFFDHIWLPREKGIEIEVEETGATFLENAFLKAKAVMRATGLPALADDSGLVVDALHGAPGVYSARYSGLHATDQENNALLLSRLQGVQNRSARFVSALVLAYPDGKRVEAVGVAEGSVLEAEEGSGGFGYDPLFYSIELKKSFGVATSSEKNAVSHRGKALENLVKKLSENRAESIDKDLKNPYTN